MNMRMLCRFYWRWYPYIDLAAYVLLGAVAVAASLIPVVG